MQTADGGNPNGASLARPGIAGVPSGAGSDPGPRASTLRFDWTDWLPYLEDQDIPDEQKRELIETLWGIIVSFVDLGWQVSPAAETSGAVLDLKAILTDADTGDGKEAV